MGACLGKKNEKSRSKKQSTSTAPAAPPIASNDSLPPISSPTTPLLENDDEDIRISMLDGQISLESELQRALDQQELINQTIAQIFPSRIVSMTDSQFEYELANLIYGQPEQEYKEPAFLPTTDAPS